MRLVAALCAGVAVALLAMVGAALWSGREDAWQQAERASSNLAYAVGRDIARNVELYDLSLQAVVEGLQIPGIRTFEPGLRDQILFDRAATAQHLGAILVLDANGDTVLDSRGSQARSGNLADRDYFAVHRDRANVGLFISRPFRSRLSGEWAIGFSRRLDGPDGAFAGVVVGTLRLAYFHDLMDQLRLGHQGAATLVRDDGVLIAREPWAEGDIGRDVSDAPLFRHYSASRAGAYEDASRVDGVRRVYSFRQVGTLPLVLTVSTSADGIYAPWRRKAMATGAIVLVLAGISGALALVLRRELRRRRRSEMEARASAARYRLLAENTSDVILRVGLDGTRHYVSPSVRHVLGWEPDGLIGRPWDVVVHPEDRQATRDALASLRQGSEDVSASYRCLRRDGVEVWMEARLRLVRDPVTGEPAEMIAVARDVSRRKRAEDELAAMAATDGLTGLANRWSFDAALEREWHHAARDGLPLSLLMMDADCFKGYNDRYGHPGGDGVLKAIAASIAAHVRRPGDLAARYGGEEFAVLLPGTDLGGAFQVAELIRQAVAARAIPHEGSPSGRVTVSVGAACLTPNPDTGSATLLGSADAALYLAKSEGRNRTAISGAVRAGAEAQRPIPRSCPDRRLTTTGAVIPFPPRGTALDAAGPRSAGQGVA